MSYVPMTGAEPMHMKEMRGALQAFRLRYGNQSNLGTRFLVLGDNMGVFAFWILKGRCTNAPLLHSQRKLASYTLATGSAGGRAMGVL